MINDAWDSRTYYYSQSKYTDKRKLPALVVDNLEGIINNNDIKELEHFYFKYDGLNLISYDIVEADLSLVIFSKDAEGIYDVRIQPNFGSKSHQIYYRFDKNFKYIGGFIEFENDAKPSNEDLKNVEKYLSEMSDKLLENYEPLINYQWFYDVFFTDRTVDQYD